MFPLFLGVEIEDETIVYSRDSDFRSPWSVKRYVKKVSKDLSKKRKKFNKLKEEVGYTFAKSKLGYDPNDIDFDLDREKREIVGEYISKRKSEICDKIFDLHQEESDIRWAEKIWGPKPIQKKSVQDSVESYEKKEDIFTELELSLRS